MGNYSYSEIQEMQRKAMERVREMKKNSDIVTHSAQKEFNQEKFNVHSQEFVEPKITNMPPNFPDNNKYPSFNSVKEVQIPAKIDKENPVENRASNPIETFFAEPDKALLLGLIMLLKAEKADEALILALTYILS
jgi:hypothetical protein